MIRIQGLTLSRGTTRLLDGADASISAGERVALIGLNGSGKSTLFAALTGDLAPDQGSVEQPYSGVTLLRQSAPSGSMPAWRYLLDGDTHLCAAERALEAAQACMLELEQFADQTEPGSPEEAGLALAQANAEWLDAGGADARPRAMALLAGLGFREGQSEEPVDHLSGGWRMRLNLARALFDPGNLLLLDEPTNHLDLDAIVWLERWLQRLEGTLIVISHDRDFLDRVVHSSLHIDEGKLVRYAGGYSEFERLRAERQRQAAREQKATAERSAHLQAFINRFRAQASKARQVQSRVKALERMSNVAAIGALRGVDIRLEDPGDSPDPLLIAEDLDVGYSETPILRRVNLQLRRGARIGILGRNGAGKSTLIRTLVGELTPISGALLPSRTLRIGYFDQQAIERLEGSRSPLELFAREAPTEREQTLRDRLGRFGFRGEDAARPVSTMSGGEKARLSLALIAWHKPHLLVLDEPTNHLDAQTRDSLAEAIAGFEGAVLLVSHDRYLLRASVDELVWVDNGALSPYDGDLDDYAQWVLKRREDSLAQPDRGTRAGVATPPSPPADRKAERRNAAQRRSDLAAATRPLDKEIATLEARLAQIQKRVADIELRLQDAGLYDAPNSAELLARLARERGELSTEQEHLEGHWFELQAQRDDVLDAYRSQEGAA